MGLDSTIVAGLMGAGVMLFLSAIPFFIGWGSIHATHEALKLRVRAVEEQMKEIGEMRADISYIRGRLDGTWEA
jgi:hypothetical protein